MKKQMKKTFKVLDKLELGKYRTWITRLGGYLAPINFILILYGFVTNDPFGVSWQLWVIIALLGLPMLMVFDIMLILPSELRYGYDKNKRMTDLEGKIDRLLELLEDDEYEARDRYAKELLNNVKK